MFELNNDQRKNFGLDPIADTWTRVSLSGDNFRPSSILYFEGDVIKKQVISNDNEYKEIQYNEPTENQELILPKNDKGKAKPLTASILASRKPLGVYLTINTRGELLIANHTTHTVFYSRDWEFKNSKSDIQELINEFIEQSSPDHLEQIEAFKMGEVKNVNYKAGDFFSFKLNRNEYGFGRVLFDVTKARKENKLDLKHGLNLLMGPAVLIKIYAHKSKTKTEDISVLKESKSLPSDYIMDNNLFYGEYEIIGHSDLDINEIDFPISYGIQGHRNPNVFLQWGLIHKERSSKKFSKFLKAHNYYDIKNDKTIDLANPYSYCNLELRSKFDTIDIIDTINNKGDFDNSNPKFDFDLRNPQNQEILNEILGRFAIDPDLSYAENLEKESSSSY